MRPESRKARILAGGRSTLRAAAGVFFAVVILRADVPKPEKWLGFDPAADGAIVDTSQVNGYLQAVARATPRAMVCRIGLSTDGHPLTLVAVSHPDNLRAWVQGQRSRLPPEILVALVTFGIHSDEVGSTLSSLPILHRLVTERSPRARDILRRTLVLMVPAVNPDGTRTVAEWLRTVRHPLRSLPTLYHRYCGHDLNRDWLLATQPETRSLMEAVYDVWRPELVIDVHQMGRHGPRLFIPPFARPIDPALDEKLMHVVESLGQRVFATLVDDGRRGVVRRWVYDAWSAARGFPLYRRAVRFLIEAASADYERPVQIHARDLRRYLTQQPSADDRSAAWTGGRWGLPEISDSLITTTEMVLAAALDTDWRRELQEVRQGDAGPRVRLNVAGQDPWLAGDLLRALARSGARLQPSGAGSWVVADPPGGKGWCRSVLLATEYPRVAAPVGRRRRPPYDTSTHDLASLAGVEAEPAGETPSVTGRGQRRGFNRRFIQPGRVVESRTSEPSPAVGDWLVSFRSLGVLAHTADLLDSGARIDRLRRDATVDGHSGAAGDFVIRGAHRAWIHRLAATTGTGARRVAPNALSDDLSVPFLYPELWVYRGNSPARDEGWLRWFLEAQRVRFQAATRRDLVAGSLSSGHGGRSGRRVLIFPARTLSPDPELEKAVGQWARDGGRVIALGDAAGHVGRWLTLENLRIPLPRHALPGVVLRARLHPAARQPSLDPVLWGYTEPPPLLYRNGPLWSAGAKRTSPAQDERAAPEVRPLVVVDAERPHVAGLLAEEVAKRVAGGAAVLRIRSGGGEWILFGFSPHFRGWTRATFRLLLNAVFAP